ncbi:MAG: HAMP domain-containing protein [Desulfobulbaceae bacterium]|nr:HAMP domain-containing protein [Desulfobulbaceae bacterium]
MQWFHDLSIKAKLLAGFIAVALVTVTIGLFAVVKLHELNTNSTMMYENRAVPLGHLIDMSTSFQRLRVNILYYMSAGTPAERAQYLERIAKIKADLDTVDNNYAKTFSDETDKQLFADYEAKQQAYFALLDRLKPLVESGKTEEARAFAKAEMAPTAGALGEIITKNQTMQVEDAKAQADANAASAGAANRLMYVIMVLSGLLAVGLGFFIANQITLPMLESIKFAEEIAKGIFTSRLKLNRQDEIGQLTGSLDHMAESLARQVEVARTIAGGDLTCKIELSSPQDTLGQALQTMQQGLAVTITQTKLAGNEIANGSLQIADSSQSLAQGASEQASSLEEISSAMTQMSSQTKMTADNAHKAQELSNSASAAAEEGNRQMQEMVAAMEEIRVASQSVANVIKVIEEIAFQTNMLALNAAVEAAHAGQHGKGFAVVAEEVRNLAARSAKAAKETADLIAGSVSKTENGAKIADLTAASLAEITNRVTQASELVKGIAEAAREQSQGIDQVSQGLHQIDQVTQQNSANAEEGAAASEQLSGQASQLNQLMQAFKVDSGNTVINPSQQMARPGKSTGGMKRPKQLGMTPKAARPTHDTNANPSTLIPLDDAEFGKY